VIQRRPQYGMECSQAYEMRPAALKLDQGMLKTLGWVCLLVNKQSRLDSLPE
jgi:hypothetical protein